MTNKCPSSVSEKKPKERSRRVINDQCKTRKWFVLFAWNANEILICLLTSLERWFWNTNQRRFSSSISQVRWHSESSTSAIDQPNELIQQQFVGNHWTFAVSSSTGAHSANNTIAHFWLSFNRCVESKHVTRQRIAHAYSTFSFFLAYENLDDIPPRAPRKSWQINI